MKFAPPADPRKITPAFSYAIQFCGYGWVASIDEHGVQSRSLAPGRVAYNIDAHPHLDKPVYQVHELPVLE